MKQKLLTLFALLLGVCSGAWAAVSWPDANYLLLDGKTKDQIGSSNSTSYTNQVGGSGATWSCNTGKYSYGATTCTFYGNAFTKGLKHEGATWTQVVTTSTATLTIVQSLATNPTGTLLFENTAIADSKKEISTWDNYQEISYSGTQTVGGKTYKDVKVIKLYNLPAGTYKIYRGTASVQTYVVYMGVTYETTPSYTITVNMSNGGESTVSGGGSFLKGFSTTLTASPGAGKAFDHWELGGSNISTDNPYDITVSEDATYTAVFTNAATKGITAVSSNDTYGSAEATATTIAEGGSTTLTATPASEAYYFVNWTKSSDGSWSSNTNPLTISYDDLTDGETYTANFSAYYKITYSVGTYSKGTQTSYQNGTMTKYASSIGQIIMPTNYAFVYSDDFDEAASHTLWAWNNGGGNHVVGGNYKMNSDELNYVPVFTTNTVSLAADLTAPQTVTWNFASNAAAPDVHVEGNTGYYVVQTTIKEKEIDVPMYITGAKFNMGETRAQVNATTNFKVPAVKGMVVTYTADNGSPTEADFGFDDAENISFSAEGKIATITYTGTNSSLTISDKNGNFWPKSLAITYPASSIAISTLSGRNYASYVTTNKLDFASAEGIQAFIATGLNGGKDAVLLEEVDIVPAGTPIIVKTETKGATVNVPVTTAEPSDVSGNKLVAGDGTTDATGSTYYYLASDQFHLATSGKLQSGKAYLEIPASARNLTITFGDATSIKAIDNSQLTIDNYYNLKGQRVVQPTKGLYIQDGKKVIIK